MTPPMGKENQMGVCNEEKWIEHYSSSHKILLVGEGDFSFAVCLAKAFGTAENMIATSFDSKEVLTNAYTNAMTNLEELKQLRCTVLHHVDAHIMYRHPHLRAKLFDRVIFNFPHAGFMWLEYEERQIELHRTLVRGFLSNANHMLTENGEVHITHKTTFPFDKWKIVELAREIGLCLIQKVPFDIRCYPGYVNKKGSGPKINQTFPLGECSTFKFASSLSFYNTLIDDMCNAGKLTIAREMFNSLPTKGLQPNVRTYNIMINGFCKEGLLNEARELFEKMDKNNCSLNQGFLQQNEISWAVKYFHMMDDKGFSANATTETTWIDFLSAKKADQAARDWKSKQDEYAEMRRRKDEEHEAKEHMLVEQFARDWQNKQDKYAEMQRRKDEECKAKEHMLVEQAARMQRTKDEEREANERMLAEQAARMQRWKDEKREANERMLAEQAARMQKRKEEDREAKECRLLQECRGGRMRSVRQMSVYCATMTSKKDKEKNVSSALVLKSESNIVASTSPASSLDLANRFSPFSSDYPISYSSTIISPYDSFVDASQMSRAPGIDYKKPSTYMVVPFSQHLFTIELNRSSAKSAGELALSYFPPNFHWIPEHPQKNLAFYSNILSQTKSLHFKPIFCQTFVPKKIIYHSVYFDKVISQKDWGDHPSSCRSLKGFDIPFSYYDYIDAWSKFFLFQTPNLDHSWFINFDCNNFGGILPLWFARWWSHFGLIPEVLPLKLIESFNLFKTCFKTNDYGSKFPPILHFAKKFKLPWILKWQYVIVEDKLERHWYVKWWDKFTIDPIIQNVKVMIQAPKAQNLPLPSIISPKLLTPDAICQSTKDLAPFNVSPTASSSSKKLSFKSKKKKALLKAMALLDSLSGSSDDDEDGSEASFEVAFNSQRDLFGNSSFDPQEFVPGIEDL